MQFCIEIENLNVLMWFDIAQLFYIMNIWRYWLLFCYLCTIVWRAYMRIKSLTGFSRRSIQINLELNYRSSSKICAVPIFNTFRYTSIEMCALIICFDEAWNNTKQTDKGETNRKNRVCVRVCWRSIALNFHSVQLFKWHFHSSLWPTVRLVSTYAHSPHATQYYKFHHIIFFSISPWNRYMEYT